MISIILFWLSIALTEAWKWRKMEGSEDKGIITEKTYHTWRLVTNFSVFMIPFEMLLFNSIPLFASSFIIGWYIYERMISYVQYGNFTTKRAPFHFQGMAFNRPNPIYELVLVLALVALILLAM